MVACCAKDLDDGRAQERIVKVVRTGHGATWDESEMKVTVVR